MASRQALVAAADALAREEAGGQRITFHLGDARQLDFADASFGVVIAYRLVSHVADTLSVFA